MSLAAGTAGVALALHFGMNSRFDDGGLRARQSVRAYRAPGAVGSMEARFAS